MNELELENESEQTIRIGNKDKKKKSNSDPLGIGGFICGLFLIPFSLVLLWKNEQKLVTFSKVVSEGRTAVQTINCDNPPDDANEFKLVHMTGTAVNNDTLEDT